MATDAYNDDPVALRTSLGVPMRSTSHQLNPSAERSRAVINSTCVPHARGGCSHCRIVTPHHPKTNLPVGGCEVTLADPQVYKSSYACRRRRTAGRQRDRRCAACGADSKQPVSAVAYALQFQVQAASLFVHLTTGSASDLALAGSR